MERDAKGRFTKVDKQGIERYKNCYDFWDTHRIFCNDHCKGRPLTSGNCDYWKLGIKQAKVICDEKEQSKSKLKQIQTDGAPSLEYQVFIEESTYRKAAIATVNNLESILKEPAYKMFKSIWAYEEYLVRHYQITKED